MESELKTRKLRWIDHTLRKPVNFITRKALQRNPQGKRKVGRPKDTRGCNLQAEMAAEGYKGYGKVIKGTMILAEIKRL